MAKPWEAVSRSVGLLVDTNLLVLRVVGDVNPERIGTFKRVSNYTWEDYKLLHWFMKEAAALFTTPQVMAEVSNLTDLKNRERQEALRALRVHIEVLNEFAATSDAASEHATYQSLGLTDSAILLAAERQQCAVLTDDLDLYLALQARNVPGEKFTHLRAALL